MEIGNRLAAITNISPGFLGVVSQLRDNKITNLGTDDCCSAAGLVLHEDHCHSADDGTAACMQCPSGGWEVTEDWRRPQAEDGGRLTVGLTGRGLARTPAQPQHGDKRVSI